MPFHECFENVEKLTKFASERDNLAVLLGSPSDSHENPIDTWLTLAAWQGELAKVKALVELG